MTQNISNDFTVEAASVEADEGMQRNIDFVKKVTTVGTHLYGANGELMAYTTDMDHVGDFIGLTGVRHNHHTLG